MEDDGFVSHSLLPSLISVNIKSCAVCEVPEQSVILLPENKQPSSALQSVILVLSAENLWALLSNLKIKPFYHSYSPNRGVLSG